MGHVYFDSRCPKNIFIDFGRCSSGTAPLLGTGQKQVDLNLKFENLIWSENDFFYLDLKAIRLGYRVNWSYLIWWSFLNLYEKLVFTYQNNQIRLDRIRSSLKQTASDEIRSRKNQIIWKFIRLIGPVPSINRFTSLPQVPKRP